MANEFVVADDLLVYAKAAVGDRRADAVDNILGNLDVVDSTGAVVNIISGPSVTSTVNFGESDANFDTGVIRFDNSLAQFEIDVSSTTQLIVDGTGVTVTGNLTVSGTTTTVNTTNTTISDNIITLNDSEVGAGVTAGTAGIEIDRGSLDNAGWFYNESQNWWGPTGPSGSIELGTGATNVLGNVNEIDCTTGANADILTITGTGAITVPSGTTAEQPTAVAGMLRYNTTTGAFEFYDSDATWNSLAVGGGAFVATSGDTMTGDLTISGAQILLDDGSMATPAIAFDSETNTGFYRSAGNAITLAVAGTDAFTVDATTTVFTRTGAIKIPTGTTGEQPGSPANGMLRYNSTNDQFEGYVSGTWLNVITSSSGNFVETIGDTMTGDLVMDQTSGADIYPNMDDTGFVGLPSQRWNTMYATTFDGTATMALYADLAERYATEMTVNPGDVVVFGGEAEITPCSMDADTAVAGIISEKPGVMMNCKAGDEKTHPYVALKGKIPCKVVGPVKKGDLIVTSSVLGHGKSAGKEAEPYTAFARALDNLNIPERAVGVVMVSVI